MTNHLESSMPTEPMLMLAAGEQVAETATNELLAGVVELDQRETDGLVVHLLWEPESDKVVVAVQDVRTGEDFELLARRDNAYDVFYHPFAHRRLGPLAVEAA